MSRRHFRQRRAHVLHDPVASTYFRLDPISYHLVALLDGQCTVEQAWWLTTDRYGDTAPTQNEVLGLLSQMFQLNLLAVDGVADGEQLFARKKRRRQAKAKRQAASWLFVKLPLIDPAPVLDFLLPLVRWLLKPWALVAWLLLLVWGLSQVLLHWNEFRVEATELLRGQNMLWLLVVFVTVKLFHEFGHGLVCRKFGGAVHEMGIMFLVFHPVPYCDATSSWGLANRWQRAMVGMVGVVVELAFAAVGAVVWAKTQSGLVHDLAYNTIFIAGVAALLFNANPLLRYDGYYILSDLLDIPNLYKRANDQVKYLIQRLVFGLDQIRPVTNSTQEMLWMVVYWVSAWIYRLFVFVAIIWFVSAQFFGLGILLALFAGFMWICVPLGKFAHWLSASPALRTRRLRAAVLTAVFVGLPVASLGLIPIDEHVRALAVIENPEFERLVLQTDGFVQKVLVQDGQRVEQGQVILVMSNPWLRLQKEEIASMQAQLEIQQRDAASHSPSDARVIEARFAALRDQTAQIDRQIAALRLISPIDGVVVSPRLDEATGRFLSRGDLLGEVRDEQKLRAAAVLDQTQNAVISEHDAVQLRTVGQPDRVIEGTVERKLPGRQVLRHQALGAAVGGSIATDARDLSGMITNEDVFEVHLALDEHTMLHPGQRAVVRFTLEKRPLLVQWWWKLLQTIRAR